MPLIQLDTSNPHTLLPRLPGIISTTRRQVADKPDDGERERGAQLDDLVLDVDLLGQGAVLRADLLFAQDGGCGDGCED